ncbi:MAG: glycine cleavage system aminomethyltransferase GcvT [Pirellulales bacterium]|nr:glycine cleavage system aminomethyltransferase GcvT [Pirellulales bacterium]
MTAVADKKTPLNAWHRAHGARMVDFGGWDMPIQYADGILSEHLATRKHAGLFDVSHMGRFRISGKDTVRFLQHVLSNNVDALEPWESQYTLIPDDQGGVVDDAYLYRFGEDDYLLVVNASNREKDWEHFERFAGAFDIVLEDHTEKLAMIALQGPLAGQVLSELVEQGSLPEAFRNCLSEIMLCGSKVLVGRTGYTGEPIGFELFVDAQKAETVWSAIHEAGKDRGVVPVGLGARDTLRLEAGLPLYGHEFGLDMQDQTMPAFACPIAGIAISFSERKGDFVGRGALAEQFEQVQKFRAGVYEASGVLPRRVRPLALLDRGVARRGSEVFLDGKQVGEVTSGTVAPYWRLVGEGACMTISDETENRSIALAYIDAAIRPEEEVEVSIRGRRVRGKVVRWHGRSEAAPYFHAIPADWQKPEPALVVAQGMKKVEELLEKSVANHHWRQHDCVNLIPSEMTPSPLVRLLQVSDPVGRYAEHKELLAAFEQDVFYYQGTEFIGWVEQRLQAEMADFLGCPLVEARLVSGQMANATVFSAMVDYRNRTDRRREPGRIGLVMNNHIAKGGHLSAQPMGALRDYVAKDPVSERYAVVAFPVLADNPYKIDLDAAAGLLERFDPELLILGKSMVLHPEPVAQIRKMVENKTPRPVIMYDMAHVLGLIGPHFQQPFSEGADLVTGSTHKTFFGTQRGVIGGDMAEDAPQFELWKAIRRRAFPGMVSNHHLGTLLGLLMAAIEMNTFKDDYQSQVIANAKAFARALKDEGLDVEGDPAVDFTETHQVIVNVAFARGCEIAQQLEDNNIIVNYQAIPGDQGFTCSSALRIGVSEMTRFGMKEADFQAFAPLVAEAIKGNNRVGEKVTAFRQGFQTMHYCFDSDVPEALRRKVLKTLF